MTEFEPIPLTTKESPECEYLLGRIQTYENRIDRLKSQRDQHVALVTTAQDTITTLETILKAAVPKFLRPESYEISYFNSEINEARIDISRYQAIVDNCQKEMNELLARSGELVDLYEYLGTK